MDNQAVIDFVESLLLNTYTVVEWPDSQAYMDQEWFENEAILDVDAKFGSSAYFIPTNRILDSKRLGNK